MRWPSAAKAGRMAANTSSGAAAMMVSFAAVAPATPPETGASTNRRLPHIGAAHGEAACEQGLRHGLAHRAEADESDRLHHSQAFSVAAIAVEEMA
jgi:hypothetical protein